MGKTSSREHMLKALSCEEADHIPCCFMSFTALRKRCNEDMFELCKAEREMGFDSMLFIPAAPRSERTEHPDLRGLPVRFHPQVSTRTWRENGDRGETTLHREYSTPSGTLCTSVRVSDDWPHGEHIPFVDDFQVPRSIKNLITGPEDLPALAYLLVPPTDEDKASFQQEAGRAHTFVKEHEVLLAGGWGVGLDMANWLCGMQNLMMLTMTDSDFVAELLKMIHEWNMKRMRVVLEGGVDLYIRRAWYEGCDFVIPDFFEKAVLPHLKSEVDLAHVHGTKFGYICSSGTRPMLDFYMQAGIDVLIGIDPVQGTYTDMAFMREKAAGKMCLWGGVCGAVTVEMGSEDEIRAAVRAAIDTLGPDGFILSPIDNITVDAPKTWSNIDVFKDEWQRTAGA